MWWCGCCERTVEEGQIDAHLLSNKHTRYKEWYLQKAVSEQRLQRGELPEWVTLKDGGLCLSVCA